MVFIEGLIRMHFQERECVLTVSQSLSELLAAVFAHNEKFLVLLGWNVLLLQQQELVVFQERVIIMQLDCIPWNDVIVSIRILFSSSCWIKYHY